MGNKKVIVIPPASTFSRYIRARDGMLRLAVYTDGLLPLDTVQMCFANILRQRKNWSLVGICFDDCNSGKNKNDFNKLLKLCEGRKVDMIECRFKSAVCCSYHDNHCSHKNTGTCNNRYKLTFKQLLL